MRPPKNLITNLVLEERIGGGSKGSVSGGSIGRNRSLNGISPANIDKPEKLSFLMHGHTSSREGHRKSAFTVESQPLKTN